MLTALCISFNDTDTSAAAPTNITMVDDRTNLKIFYSNKNSFVDDLVSLANQKQLYELNYKDNFSKVIYINSSFDTSKVKSIKPVTSNTLYSVAMYENIETALFFVSNTQYFINPNFFYCDSKTFNLVSLYSKFKNMISGERAIPEKLEFYIFLLNMGIKIDDM